MVSHLNEWPELGTNRGALNVRKWVSSPKLENAERTPGVKLLRLESPEFPAKANSMEPLWRSLQMTKAATTLNA